jgi:hypothetical protein
METKTDKNKQDVQRPEKTFRLGNCKASVWKNKLDKGFVYNVTLVRSYLDGNGEWRDTASFGPNDIHKAITVLQDAYVYILSARSAEQPTD